MCFASRSRLSLNTYWFDRIYNEDQLGHKLRRSGIKHGTIDVIELAGRPRFLKRLEKVCISIFSDNIRDRHRQKSSVVRSRGSSAAGHRIYTYLPMYVRVR